MSERRKLKVATTSLAGCFGCHMSFLDIDERLFTLLEQVEFDRSPLTDIKTTSPDCDIGLIAGGACAINGGLPAQRNHLPLTTILEEVYHTSPGLANGMIPNDPELPLPLNQVHPIHEVVKVDYFIPGCPPSGDAIWKVLTDLLAGREPELGHGLMHYD